MAPEEGQGGGCDPGHAAGRPERGGTRARELLAQLEAESVEAAIIEVARQGEALVAPQRLDLPLEAAQIGRVAGLDLDLFGDLPRHVRELRPNGGEAAEIDPRQGEELAAAPPAAVAINLYAVRGRLVGGEREVPEPRLDFPDLRLLAGEPGGPARADTAECHADRGEPAVGIVRPEEEAILGAGSEHPVGLAGALRDQVVDHDADHGAGPVEDQPIASARSESGVEPGEQALSRRLLVARGAVDLAGQEETGQSFELEGGPELARVDVIVLDRVAGTDDFGPLEAGDRGEERPLELLREGRRDTVRVEEGIVQPLGLEEDVVAPAIRETDHLVLERRTIAHAHRSDLAVVDRRLVKALADQAMSPLGRPGDPAGDLPPLDPIGEKGEGLRRIVADLRFEAGEIDAVTGEARRRTGLEAREGEALPQEASREAAGGGLAEAARRPAARTEMDLAAQEGSGGEDHGPRPDALFCGGLDTATAALRDEELSRLACADLETGLLREKVANGPSVEPPVGLGPRPARRRALAGREHAELDAGGVDRAPHEPVERVDLADELAPAEPTDRRVAGHGADRPGALRQEKGAGPEPRRRGGRLGPRMATPDNDNIDRLHGGGSAEAAGGRQGPGPLPPTVLGQPGAGRRDGGMVEIAAIVFEIGGLLALVALLPPAARALGLPATVLLAALGCALAVATNLAGPGGEGLPDPFLDFLRGFGELTVTSELFLWVFLPILLFETALALDGRELLEELGPVLVLTVLAVLVCTLGAGLAVWWATGYGLPACLLVAAIIATTDPSAVVSIFREVGAPRRLTTLVEGESLLNDAAAIALFGLVLAVVLRPGGFNATEAAIAFVLSFLGGGATGIVLGRLAAGAIGRLDRGGPAEATASLALAYLAYAVSDLYLGVSGVVATVVAGLVFGTTVRGRLAGAEWERMRAIWAQLGFWASSLVFVLAAALVPSTLAAARMLDLVGLAALILGALLARWAVLYGVMPLVTRLGGGAPIDRRYSLVILWGGLRGAVTLALALSVTENRRVPAEVQHLVSVLATGFVLFTLLVQATTLRPLLRWLGLDRLSPVERILRERVLELTRAELRDRLSAAAIRHGVELDAMPSAVVPTLSPGASVKPGGDISREQLVAALATVTGRESELYVRELAERMIARSTGALLVRRADALLDALRQEGVHGYRHVARRQDELDAATRFAAWLHLRVGFTGLLARQLGLRLEKLLVRRRVLEELLGFTRNRIRRVFGERIAATTAQVLEERLEGVERQLDALRLQFPKHWDVAAGHYLARVALQLEEEDYERLYTERLLSPELFRNLETDLRARRRALERTPRLDLGLDPDSLIARVPLLADLPEERRRELRRLLRPRLALPGELIVRRGTRGDAIYFIASGAVEVDLEEGPVRLGTGDVFGEMALLLRQPRRAAVTALGYCRLLVLPRDSFRRFLRGHPELVEQLRGIAGARLGSAGTRARDHASAGVRADRAPSAGRFT